MVSRRERKSRNSRLSPVLANAYTGRLHSVMTYLQAVGSFGLLFLTSAALVSAADEKAAFDRSKAVDGGLGMPTPYDKFLALDQVLPKGKIDWAKAYRATAVSLDPDAYKDPEVSVPMALGVRIADGVMAVKAKDAELLNKCASDIERLARKMGIAESDLSRARAVRTAANKGEWLQVFLELGFFQQDIMKKIEQGKDRSRGDLLIVSGWMEGASFTTALVQQNYTTEVSNILREPLLVKALLDRVEALPSAVKEKPAVAGLRKLLPQIVKLVDIPRDGSMTKDNVAELHRLSSEAVKLATHVGS